jgi:glycine C-acetyltransferase
MADIFEKLLKNSGPIGQHRERAHGYFAFPKLEGEIGSRMKFRGKEMVVWSLNNYLGLANHPEIRKTDADAAAQFGLALPMGARMMSGNSNYHEQLEKELAEFEGKEDAILMNFGYQGIMSAIDAVCGRHDVIVYDAESHACIIDGLRLHPGHRYVFKHNDLEDLRQTDGTRHQPDRKTKNRRDPDHHRRCIRNGRRPGQTERDHRHEREIPIPFTG